MFDEIDIIKNISTIYDSNSNLRILKDFERVLDELNLYVFKNWEDGELVSGPKISRHWVECSFLWHKDLMPDPKGGKVLVDYGCIVSYKKDTLVAPKKIKKPSDIKPGTKIGKPKKEPIWIVNIKMPKQLIVDIFKGNVKEFDKETVDLESIYQSANDGISGTQTNVNADANASATPQEIPQNAPTI